MNQPVSASRQVAVLPRTQRNQSALTPLKHLFVNLFSVGIVCMLVFNYGFQMIRVPPSGAGVPIIEILALMAVPFIIRPAVLRALVRSPVFAPLCLWILWGGMRIAVSFPEYRMLAIRDGLPVLESIFLVMGFGVASQAPVVSRYIRWLPILVMVILGYALVSPFAETLTSFSPKLPSTQGVPVPIFFMYGNTPTLLVAGAAFLWFRSAVSGHGVTWLPAFFIVVALLLFPSRSLLLQVLTMVGLLMVSVAKNQRRAVFSILWLVGFAITGILLLSFLGIQIAGRLGALSPEDYLSLMREIMIWQPLEPGTTLSSGGSERLLWWTDIITQTTADIETFIFGIGYGAPLMEGVFHNGVITREPHNSWISVFGRSGIVGLIFFSYLCVVIGRLSWQQVRARSDSALLGPFCVFCAMLVFGTLVLGLGETPFVMPFFAVPYYFVAGVIARMAMKTRKLPSDSPMAEHQSQVVR